MQNSEDLKGKDKNNTLEDIFRPKFDENGNQLVEAYRINYESFGTFLLKVTNKITHFRANTFLTKEPETLKWLQKFIKDSWLIDVGANIGIYTLPAAKFHTSKVIAVEAEANNYSELLKNIAINKIQNKIEAYLLGISTKYSEKLTKLYLVGENVGSSCHQLGSNTNHMLQPLGIERPIRSIYSISLAKLIIASSIPSDIPLHIKVDVDGIEADVCESLFSSGLINRISSILVELNPIDLKQHKQLLNKFLTHGFIFSEDQVQKRKVKEGPFRNFANYIFIPNEIPCENGEPLSNLIKTQHKILQESIRKDF